MHDVLTIGIPLLAIFAGILLNRNEAVRLESRIDKLHAKIDKLEGKFDARFDQMQRDLIQFYRDIGRHDARLDELEKKRS